MVFNFRFADYKCQYLAGAAHKRGVCFSEGFQEGIIDGKLHITYLIPKELEELNYMFITKDQLFDYLYEVSHIIGFTVETIYDINLYYKVQVSMAPENRYFRYVSTIVRFTWEFPFSVATYCVLQNRQNFPELDLVQIMQFYLGVFCDRRQCHYFARPGYVYSNMNSKCHFNIVREQFNNTSPCVKTTNDYDIILDRLNEFNAKCLPVVSESINKLANEVYEKYKKDICCW